MVAIVSGNSLGLNLGSLATLGQQGVFGQAAQGSSGERVYVNGATGNLVLQREDDHLLARGPDSVALRTYNSQGLFGDDNGDNWSSGVWLQPLALVGTLNTLGSTLQRTDADGSVAIYAYQADGVYRTTAGAGAYDSIRFVAADNQFEWRDGDTGATQRYEASGSFRLLSARDTSGNTLAYSYNAAGRLASVLTANGETTFYEYIGNNLSRIHTLASSGTDVTDIRYAYDDKNRLSVVTVDLTPADNAITDAKAYTTTYTYEGTSKRVASIVQSDGTALGFTYVGDKVATVTNGLGQVTTFTYGTGAVAVRDPLGMVTTYGFDAAGQLTKVTSPAVNGSSAVQVFTWDSSGNLVAYQDGEGRTTVYEYDKGNQTLRRDALGNSVIRTFDANNQLLTETEYKVPDPDGSGAGLPTQPMTKRFVYDGAGRNLLRFTISAEGRVTENRYEWFGQLTTTFVFAGSAYPVGGLGSATGLTESDLMAWAASQPVQRIQRQDFSYLANGALQSRTSYAKLDAAAVGVLDGSQSRETFVYDPNGWLLQSVSATGATSVFNYDGLGRLRSQADALGQVSATDWQDAALKDVSTLANTLVTTRVHDAAGRLASVSDYGTGNVLLGTTRYFYDAAGRLRATKDPTGVCQWTLYDDAGRKVADIDGNGTFTEYQYDRSDLLVCTIRYANRVDTAALVDASGVPSTNTSLALRPAATATDVKTWRMYDAAGRLVREAHTTGTGLTVAVTETRYDGASHVTAIVRYANLASAPVAAGSGYTISLPTASPLDRTTRNFYDADGLLAATLDAQGYLVVFSYNADGRLAERLAYANATPTAQRASGDLPQLRPATSAADIRSVLLYDAKGQLAAEVDGEGYLTENARDNAGNITKAIRYAARVWQAYSAASSLVDIRPPANVLDRATTRAYDGLNRVVQETSPENVVTQYAYDSAGNLVSTTLAAGSSEVRTLLARYDLQGRLAGELSAEGAALLTGGQTLDQVNAIWAQYGNTYAYDAAGRRIATTDALGQRTLFFYNEDGALAYTVNALGEVRQKLYDNQERLTGEVAYATRINNSGMAGGLVTSALTSAIVTSSADVRTTISYTLDDLVASSTDALGNVTTNTYNSFGELASVTQPVGGSATTKETYTVDQRGLRTNTTTDSTGIAASVTVTYDAFGRVTRTVDANSNARDLVYDRLGRVVTARDPASAATVTAYDAFDRVLTQTDPLGNTTTYTYDAAARTLSVLTPEGIRTVTAYTRHGQVLSVTDGKGQATNYVYDRDGNLLRTITPLTVASSSYDRADRLIQTIDAGGTKVTYSYDAANRQLTRRVDPDGLALTTTYQYDALGRQMAVTDANQVVTTFEYDRKGEVLKQTVDPAGLNLQTLYSYDPRGKVLSVTSAGLTLTQYSYDAMGRRVQERVDPAALNLTRNWTYDKNGNVRTATDATGNVTRYVYDGSDRLLYTIDALGEVTQLGYDTAGRQVRSVSYAKPIDLANLGLTPTAAQVQALLMPQTAADQVENRVYDRDGRVAATVDGLGAVVIYGYDANGNVVNRIAYANPLASWTPGTMPAPTPNYPCDQQVRTVYDALNRAIYTMDAMGDVVAQTYDGNGRVLTRTAYATPVAAGTPATQAGIAAAVASIANSARDASVRNVYDAAGRLCWSVDGTGAVTQRMYDRNGNAVRLVEFAQALPQGADPASVAISTGDRVTAMAYDAANRLVFQVDALSGVTEQAYDGNGNVVRRTEYSNPCTSFPAQGANASAIKATVLPDTANDRITAYSYDATGRQVLVISGEGSAVGTAYDAAGRVVAVTQYAVPVTSFAAAALSSSPRDRVTRTAYDAAGRVAFVVDPLGAVTARQYDGIGRLKQSIRYLKTMDPTLAKSASAIATAMVPLSDSAVDQVDSFSWDAAGRQIQHTDATGVAEFFGYDAVGNKAFFTNKKGSVWTYTYDAAGRLRTETTPQVTLGTVAPTGLGGGLVATAQSAAASIVTRLDYDALGNLTRRIEAEGRPEARTTWYAYDAVGRQVWVLHSFITIYDAPNDDVLVNGAMATALRRDKQAAPETRTYYDVLGNAVANYDVLIGALTQKVYDRMGRVVYDIDALGHLTRYTRNAFGEVTQQLQYAAETTLANRSVTQASAAATRAQADAVLADASVDRTLATAYDRAGQVTQLTGAVEYIFELDANGNRISGDKAAITRKRYDAFGEVVQEWSLRNAIDQWSLTTHYYDQAGREVATVDPLGYLTERSFDGRGNLKRLTEYATAVASWSDSAYAAPVAVVDDRITDYGYDRADRKTMENRRNVEYATGADGNSVRGDVITRYGYDVLGNLVSVTDAYGGMTATSYDVLGRVSAITTPERPVDTGDGVPVALTPLTTFIRDAYGNELGKTEYARGATPGTFAPKAPLLDADRTTASLYDTAGRLLQTTDATGANLYFSYDAQGRVAKQWQGVTGLDKVAHTKFQVNVYDKGGNLLETWTPASTTALQSGAIVDLTRQQAGKVVTKMQYNAFGDLIRRGVGTTLDESFDYDKAGRLWRTNSGDGVVRVLLHDAQGHVTAEIRSSGDGYYVDLSKKDARAADTATWTGRTQTRYDADGRVVATWLPGRLPSTADNVVSLHRQYVAGSILESTSPGYVDPTLPPVVVLKTNRVTLSWNSLRYLGSGDIKVVLEYTTLSGASASMQSEVFTAEQADSTVTLAWKEAVTAPDFGITGINRVTVYKKDVSGNWQTVIYQAPGYGPNEVDVAAPPEHDAAIQLEMRAAGTQGTGGWWACGLVNFGDRLAFNAQGLGAGTYEYRVRVTPPGGSERIMGTGTVAVPAPNGQDVQAAGLNSDVQWRWPYVAQKTDRWGNVVEKTDPRSAYWKTTYRYNANNQLVQQTLPDDAGQTSANSPVTTIYYDKLGRQAAVRDANGRVTGQGFDSGGNLAVDVQADGWLVRHTYDIFGDELRTTSAEGRTVVYTYDKAGRKLTATHGVAAVYQASGQWASQVDYRNIIERWTYDELGNKLNAINGNYEETQYIYDVQGNLLQTRLPLGISTRAAYDAQGRKIAEVDAEGKSSQWTYDYFGQLKTHVDQGGGIYQYTYDGVRQLVREVITRGAPATTLFFSYDSAGQVTEMYDSAVDKTTRYWYDLSGRRVREWTMQAGVTYQDNHLAYDARGNLRDVADSRVHIAMEYDKVGNRTHIASYVDYRGVNGAEQQPPISDRWFRYDEMNRQVIVDGVDALNIGQQGHSIAYDHDGNRISDLAWGNRIVQSGGQAVLVGFNSDDTAVYGTTPVTFSAGSGYSTEVYRYDALSRLTSVVKDGVQIDMRFYDGADRVIQSGPVVALPSTNYGDLINQGVAPGDMNGKERRLNRYDANGRLLQQAVYTPSGSTKVVIHWGPGDAVEGKDPDGYDRAGNVKGYVVQNYEAGEVTEFTNSPAYYEGAVVQTTVGNSSKRGTATTTQSYDANGYLVGLVDSGQHANDRIFVNDASGRALFVNQGGNVQRQFIVNGEVLGIYGAAVNPLASGSTPQFANLVDFDFGYARISASYPLPSPGAYTVRTGDTLQSIAQGAYGDSSLWYRIAEANGLASAKDLKVGTTLNIPNRVSSIHNNASTFEPYDPSRIEGDKTPTMPMPQNKHGCGGVGTLVMVIVAVAVTAMTGGAGGVIAQALIDMGMAAIADVGAFVIGAALGNMAGQAVGMAIGAQDRFDWKSVGLSAASAAFTAGIGVAANTPGGVLSDTFLSGSETPAIMGRAAVSNLATQGLGVATGLQDHFDWRGVAASYFGSGLSNDVAGQVGDFGGTAAGLFANRAVSAFAGGTLAQLMRGGRVVVQQVAVDAFGNTIGESLAAVAHDQIVFNLSNSGNESAAGSQIGAGPNRNIDGEGWDLNVVARRAERDPYGIRQNGADAASVMRRAKALWGTEVVGGLSDSSTESDVLAVQMRAAGFQDDVMLVGGASVRVTPRTGAVSGEINGISVNARADAAFQAAGDLLGMGDLYRDYKLLGSLMSDLQQTATLDKLKGALQEKLGMMRVVPSPEALGATSNLGDDGVVRYNNAELIDRYADALRKVEMWKRGIVELDTRSMLITSIGNQRMSPTQWVEENTQRYQRAFAAAVEDGRQKYAQGALPYPSEMPEQLQVGVFGHQQAERVIVRYNTALGVPEGPGQLIVMNRWAYDPAGTGTTIRPDMLLDLGPNRPGQVLRFVVDGKSSLVEAQSSNSQFSRASEWLGTRSIRAATPEGLWSWTPTKRR
ncbi:LysM peptidoglycan-binding domain-containing protein [Ramlibacter sp. G-1-2-2]|uniref:LysM peptidoglycan-binding domain-containing protein n=1 Tax=Ramlibacter agri TaxID=2728837 RepID=A0A848HE71_9BURK|nr:LysM peptidoglycan-binding domain-containing protein [Ramlibacter agri]NML48462.1 LysM peptidoglycan-binding domain-containing protein [Ramlibacter agri]